MNAKKLWLGWFIMATASIIGIATDADINSIRLCICTSTILGWMAFASEK